MERWTRDAGYGIQGRTWLLGIREEMYARFKIQDSKSPHRSMTRSPDGNINHWPDGRIIRWHQWLNEPMAR